VLRANPVRVLTSIIATDAASRVDMTRSSVSGVADWCQTNAASSGVAAGTIRPHVRRVDLAALREKYRDILIAVHVCMIIPPHDTPK
jgi:hypothetical protein